MQKILTGLIVTCLSATAATAEDFDSAAAGPFSQLSTTIGQWNVTDGTALIDDQHAVSGRQCLQLTGGEQTTVLLKLRDGSDTSGALVFRAERWTRREPFRFRIQKRAGDGWQEVYNGDRTIRVGRPFLSHIKVPLGDPQIRELRFTVTSPPATGILIDDLRLAPATPMKVTAVTQVPWTVPVLAGRKSSGLTCVRVETEGSLSPLVLTSILADVTCSIADVASVHACLGADQRFGSAKQVGSGRALTGAGGARIHRIQLGPNQVLQEGSNYVWLACELSAAADIDHQVGAAIRKLKFSNGRETALSAPPSVQRLGVALRQAGDDGVHTYRIPGLTTTTQGTLIGVYDVRRRGGGDLPGDIDVGMSRSTDGGRTWEPMQIIMDMGDDPNWKYDGIGDPAVLVDRNTNTIWVAATWSHGNRSWRGSGQGLEPEETGQLMLVRSDDDGRTWSRPINITKQVKHPDWCFILQGPGKGITMQDGTLVFAAQYQDPPDRRRLPHSSIIYSRDHGRTWHVGTGAFDDTTEAQVVEVSPGVLMLNCRYNRAGTRVVMTTRDLGTTWQRHETSQRSLIEPGACMASLIDVDQELGKDLGGWMLFSNPDSRRARERIMIKGSPDGGRTWSRDNRLLLDQERGRGYSCMAMIDADTIGILYEGSQSDMTFQRIPLTAITAAQEPVAKASLSPVRFADVFGSGMVLQSDTAIPIWGYAPPNATVYVSLGKEDRSVRSDASGRWKVSFPPRKVNTSGTTMTLSTGKRTQRLTDILIGEVWLCAGQSNMEWPLQQSSHGAAETASAADRNQIRLLNLVGAARGGSGVYSSSQLERLNPRDFCSGKWQHASAESAAGFSAVGWYFGRALNAELNVPIGLISPAIGGTPIEAWIPVPMLQQSSDTRTLVTGNWLDNPDLGDFCRTRGLQNLLPAIQAGDTVPGDRLGPNHSFKPGFMWAAGLEPVAPFPVRGVIWYQGESNAETMARVEQHDHLFPLLAEAVRNAWNQPSLPLLFVQLPALGREAWPEFRDRQRRLANRLPGVSMAITIDTGHPTDVHPRLKQPVGERLARLALSRVYERPGFQPDTGPRVKSVRREGSDVVVQFSHVGSGMKSADGDAIRHFQIAGPDEEFFPADAELLAADTLRITCARVSKPTSIRYAWVPYPQPAVNLVNGSELPASPFHEDVTGR